MCIGRVHKGAIIISITVTIAVGAPSLRAVFYSPKNNNTKLFKELL